MATETLSESLTRAHARAEALTELEERVREVREASAPPAPRDLDLFFSCVLARSSIKRKPLFEIARAIELEALYQRTMAFWAANRICAPTTRETWLDWIIDGELAGVT